MTTEELNELLNTYAAEQRIEEVAWFHNAVSVIAPKTIVEIGIKEGGNLKILSTHLQEDGLIVGLDTRVEIPWKMDDAKCRVARVIGDSHRSTTREELVRVLEGRPIDVLFIDGDHSMAGMLLDYHQYSPLVRSGGIIAVHDIHYLKPVRAAWDELVGQKFESEKIDSSIGIGYLIKD